MTEQRYCFGCGLKLIKVTEKSGFDPKTGGQEFYVRKVCPYSDQARFSWKKFVYRLRHIMTSHEGDIGGYI